MRLPEEIYEIVLARLTGEIKPEQEVLFQLWLKESEQNHREYREFCALWYSARCKQKLWMETNSPSPSKTKASSLVRTDFGCGFYYFDYRNFLVVLAARE